MNIIDKKFFDLAKEIESLTEEDICRNIKTAFAAVHRDTQRSLADFFNKFGFWGRLDPDAGVFEEIELKARALREHMDDFVWLYGRLADFRSKKTLFAVLNNWYRYDFKTSTETKEYLFDEYFDLDLVKCTRDEVVVDLGAYIGDSVVSYLVNYGADCYKKIYCYEITPEIFDLMKQTLSRFERIDMRLKGVSDEEGTLRLSPCDASSSSNTLAEEGVREVDVVTLDADIQEPVTLIKADIEGFEQKALRGAAEHIRRDRPKLLISVYHNNEDLWKIPRMIDSFAEGYRFYLRYKSSPVYPTEITLIALP